MDETSFPDHLGAVAQQGVAVLKIRRETPAAGCAHGLLQDALEGLLIAHIDRLQERTVRGKVGNIGVSDKTGKHRPLINILTVE
jgi:hypothetical protein